MTVKAEDVKMVINNISGQLIFLAVVLIAMIAVIVMAKKLQNPRKGFVRLQAVLAFVLILAVTVNTILFGTYRDTLNTVFAPDYNISAESTAFARDVVERTANEGIVLAKNENSALPLTTARLNVFGWASTNPLYGGAGSGASDASQCVSLLDGLKNAGIETNVELSDFYTAYRADRPSADTNVQYFTLPEPTADSYSDELIANARAFSDTAMVVLSRVSGESFDLPTDMAAIIHNDSFDPNCKSLGPNGTYENNGSYDDFEEGQHYLTLSRTERDMLDLVCNNFSKVIIVYNGAATMELGFVNEYEAIQSVLLCPGPGATGFNSLGNILTGKVNPSARTTDTWVYDLTRTPTFHNFGDFHYTNLDAYGKEIMAADTGTIGYGTFVNYNDSIYVGYKFYETAAAEGLIDYAATVQYPFGFGLSYTSFKQEMSEITEDGGKLSFTVTVTNTGDVAGKDVVEVYFRPPYTNGGVEKADTNLVAFDKTRELKPGESQDIRISFAKDDMAAFDSYGAGAYVLEKGEYGISIRSDSHTILEEKIYSQLDTETFGKTARSSDRTPAVSRFDYVEGDVTYLSRRDGFANYDEATAGPAASQYEMSPELLATYVSNANYKSSAFDNPADEMPAMGAKNGVLLNELRGLSYDDPKWDSLLDELTYEQMSALITYGGWGSNEIASIGKLATNECDGPAGVNNFFTGKLGTPYCVEVIIAQTWSKELAHEIGVSFGNEFSDIKNFGWYGPAMNTHRSAFAGRNFEYYSEDGVLAGYLAAAEVNGASEKGVYAYIKHFALNDMEVNTRSLLCTWSTEQAMREIYLKPFEICVKNFEGTGLGVMVAFNFIGTTWTGADRNLMTEVLRNEWGFQGTAITDYFGGYGYQNAEAGLLAGTDMMLNMVSPFAVVSNRSATMVKAMRQATKNILFTVVNNGQYTPENYAASTGTPLWVRTVTVIDVCLAICLLAVEFFAFRKFFGKKEKSSK